MRRTRITTIFVITPSKCYHEAIEEHFESPASYEARGPCQSNCSYCTGGHVLFSGRVSKQQLIAALQVHIFQNGAVSASNLVSLLTDKKKSYKLRMNIWGKAVDPGMVHGLVLMLIVSGLLTLRVKPQKLIGTKDVALRHIDVGLGKTTIIDDNGEEVETLAILDDSLWGCFHFR